MVERWTENPGVGGSIPSFSTFPSVGLSHLCRARTERVQPFGVPLAKAGVQGDKIQSGKFMGERCSWRGTTDCKSVVGRLRGFKSLLPHSHLASWCNLVDTTVLKTVAFGRPGSIPGGATKFCRGDVMVAVTDSKSVVL